MHQEFCLYDLCAGIHEPGRRYYVSATDHGRHVLLLGPYSSHQDALDNVDRGRHEAGEVDYRACWYAYGTCSTWDTRSTLFGR